MTFGNSPFDESLHWLRLAAAQKLAAAQMTLATLLMDGRHCRRDLRQAGELLRPLAATSAQANLVLGELHGFTALQVDDRVSALRYVLAAARLGDGRALRQLALLGACHQRWELVRPLLDAASRRGDAGAVYALASCYAEGFGGAPQPQLAATLCGTAAARSQYLAPRLIQALGNADPPFSGAQSPALGIDWPLLERALPQDAHQLACHARSASAAATRYQGPARRHAAVSQSGCRRTRPPGQSARGRAGDRR